MKSVYMVWVAVSSKIIRLIIFVVLLTELEQFLKFTTASKYLLPVGHRHIKIDINANYEGIFASTCLLELHLPSNLGNMVLEEFKATFDVVMNGSDFNTF